MFIYLDICAKFRSMFCTLLYLYLHWIYNDIEITINHHANRNENSLEKWKTLTSKIKIYLIVFCSDSCTQNNAQTKQSKRELYTLNLGHISSHFYRRDKTFFLKQYTYFSATQKYLCEQIEQIFFLDYI